MEQHPPAAPQQSEQPLSELLQIRRDKLAALQQAGRDPFAVTTYDRSHENADIRSRFDALEGARVRIAGRMTAKRIMGKASFAQLLDGSGAMQVYVRRDDVGEEAYAAFKAYDIGDILSGRCETGKAIVESPLYSGLYVVSAPYAGGEVRAEALSAFVRSAREVFDDIVLDTAAGMGAPFLAAMAVCDTCVIVTPDPVAMRDGRIVCDAVAAAGCENIRLVINRVPRRAADAAVGDFDLCIDTVGAQLLGVVPESAALAAACASGRGLAQDEPAHAVFRAIAARLCGERVPLIVR